LEYANNGCSHQFITHVPPPAIVFTEHHYSAFLRAARFGFAPSPAASAAFFRLALRFNLVLIFLRLRETPYEPFHRLPLFDFLSPLPIVYIRLTEVQV